MCKIVNLSKTLTTDNAVFFTWICRKSQKMCQPRGKNDLIPGILPWEDCILDNTIPTEIEITSRNSENSISWSKNWISEAKTSKKLNLQKWTLFSSISNSCRDMSNSLNSPVCHVVKITSQIPVYLEIENRFKVFLSVVPTVFILWK